MGSMLKQLWIMLASFFTAGQVLGEALTKGAKAVDELAGWCEESAGEFADRAREDRKQAALIRKATQQRSLEAVGLPALESTPVAAITNSTP
jgi:hypothetical protein